ncbi:alkaline phosphatase family protein [Beijerinckia indica]|uniref:Phosphoesterase n=1 Tax=Beijerinckia indica subsp. indica (strain ATCC 9039 / DSM 1715 / NCIMB 8712) TaxID=395963 RepID=B2IJ44_BEII9|nr:alkaline phosphatase family protein [Beijerinckia indica]ACB94807.1 phosphoesterase [Beijerinckia indica subsp. indica ATCC 9039]
MSLRSFAGATALLLSAVPYAYAATDWTDADKQIPRYKHIFVIVEENKDANQILGSDSAPNFNAFAKNYGNATKFYGEAHPSEENYIALVGGDTFGIHDDDAWYCVPGKEDIHCKSSSKPDYVNHTVNKPHIGTQLQAAGLTWKGYYENLPEPGSLAITASDPESSNQKAAFYAAKHSGFVNFESAQKDPQRAEHLVGFDRLEADIKAGTLPNFALIVPNQCNDMHGMHGEGIPADCEGKNLGDLIKRGDTHLNDLVQKLRSIPAWNSPENVAIVVTFDEGSGKDSSGCCGVTPEAISNFGGGHIPTVVITNHGPQGIEDDTPHNHYSLLRTIEDAFGIHEHLEHAAETDKGVLPLVKLFGVSEHHATK